MDDKSVTVVVSRRVVAGREQDYRDWVDAVSKASARFKGHLGATLRERAAGQEFHLIFRFDEVENLRAWERSEQRAEWIAKLDGIVEGGTRVDEYSGLEYLFDVKGPEVPKYKMAIVLSVVVFTMLLILRPIVSSALPESGATFQLLITVLLQVVMMTYLIMPQVYRLLSGWLES